ncbi:hypothetical protein MKW94_001216 [Papaver nudicaule]|uniref:Uncharacterized protein n=1 Tax=Papaver nudicaule TaxID=74823 RepID=A0AA41VX54_PAPNU|nr:hypothetical protein [Papaver nudicaule]
MDSSQKRKVDEIYSSEEEDADISESDMEAYEEEVYQRLKDGEFKVRLPDLNYRCPFCLGKKKQGYEYKSLVQHANGAGKISSSLKSRYREKAKHRALAMYLERDCAPVKEVVMEEVEEGQIIDVGGSSTGVKEVKYVYPWKGVLVNIERTFEDGRYVAPSGSGIKKQLAKDGFNPVRVHSLWDPDGNNTGKAIVEFTSDFSGFESATSFEKAFGSTGHVKGQYVIDRCGLGGMYGWVAKEDDYNSDSMQGIRKKGQLVTKLVDMVEEKNKNLEQVQLQYNETSYRLKNLAAQNEELTKKFNEGIFSKIRRIIWRSCLRRVQNLSSNWNLKSKSSRSIVKSWRNVRQRARVIDRSLLKRSERISQLVEAELEQAKSDENVLRIAEEQKTRRRYSRLDRYVDEDTKLVRCMLR